MVSDHSPLPVEAEKDLEVEATVSNGSRRRHYVSGRGGSGIATILSRKQTLAQRGMSVDGSVRYRAFDNDPRDKERFDPGEFIDWSGVHLGNYLRSKLTNPKLFSGLDRLGDLETLLDDLQPIEVLIGGCRDNRRIGGALYQHPADLAGDQLESDLLSPADDLREAGKETNFSADGATKNGSELETLIISQLFSAGGAFGNSGALPDAWLMTDRLLASGYSKFRIDPVIYLPEVFRTNKQERIKANTHAFLLELAAGYTQSLPKMHLGRHWVDRKPPYTLIKLMNGIDEAGLVYDQQSVYAVEAECWRLSSFGPVGDALESLIPNIVDELHCPYVAYSQNCRVLVLPVKELQRLFALRLEKMLCEHLVQQSDPAETRQRMKGIAQEWLTQQRMTPKEIGKLFATDLSGNAIAVDLKPYQNLKLAALQSTLAKYREVKFAGWQEALDKVVDYHAERLEAALAQHVGAILNQPDLSPRGVRFFLEADAEDQVEGLAYFLADLKEVLKRKLTQAQKELDVQRFKMSRRGFVLSRGYYKLFPRSYRRRLLKQTQIALALQLLGLKLRAQLELVSRLERSVQFHSQAMVTWEAVLEKGGQVVDELETQYASQRQHRPVFEENILSLAEEDGLFKGRIGRAFTLASQGVTLRWQESGRWVLQCGTGDEALTFALEELSATPGLERLLKGYLLGFWQDLDELSLESILEQRGDDPLELIERMKERSRPLISIDHVQHQVQGGKKAVELQREFILGTQRGKKGFFQGYSSPKGFQIVPTGEAGKHRLELLSSVFHINPMALAQSGSYKQAYDRQKAAGHSLHIFDEAELGLDQDDQTNEAS